MGEHNVTDDIQNINSMRDDLLLVNNTGIKFRSHLGSRNKKFQYTIQYNTDTVHQKIGIIHTLSAHIEIIGHS